MKRLIRLNTGKSGCLDTDKFSKALLTYGNTPLRGLGVSPAQILHGKRLRDTIPGMPGKYTIRREWIVLILKREEALSEKHVSSQEAWSRGSKRLENFEVGQHVLVQNQRGQHAKQWGLSGTVVEVQPCGTY